MIVLSETIRLHVKNRFQTIFCSCSVKQWSSKRMVTAGRDVTSIDDLFELLEFENQYKSLFGILSIGAIN